jgi:hypothetical protein
MICQFDIFIVAYGPDQKPERFPWCDFTFVVSSDMIESAFPSCYLLTSVPASRDAPPSRDNSRDWKSVAERFGDSGPR